MTPEENRLRNLETMVLKQKHQLDYLILLINKMAEKQGVKVTK